MSLVIIGKNGQLARALLEQASSAVCLGREDIDITNIESITSVLGRFDIDCIINASAYTAVDLAESEPEQAFDINHLGVANIANYAAENRIHLVHVSTDYVFSGDKGAPYTVDDRCAPLGVYGKSKAQGELALLKALPENGAIIRTSWVYSSQGNNFLKTMLRLMKEKSSLDVIDDQVGCPTSANNLARACLIASQEKASGIYHYTDAGVCSWYDFAMAIQELGLKYGLIEKPIEVNPIPTSAYPTAAKRPLYSVLDKSKIHAEFKLQHCHWRQQLEQVIQALANQR